jgi:hypothetical protein
MNIEENIYYQICSGISNNHMHKDTAIYVEKPPQSEE